jgi:hypothetical protein
MESKKKTNPIRERELEILLQICDNYELFKKLPINIKKTIVTKIEKGILNALGNCWDRNLVIHKFHGVEW